MESWILLGRDTQGMHRLVCSASYLLHLAPTTITGLELFFGTPQNGAWSFLPKQTPLEGTTPFHSLLHLKSWFMTSSLILNPDRPIVFYILQSVISPIFIITATHCPPNSKLRFHTLTQLIPVLESISAR